MAFDLDRYKEICGRLDYADLDLRAAFDRQPLPPDRGAQRTARLILRTLWRPVGATVMPESETAHVIRTLFSGDQGHEVAARIDRRIDNLPGLDGMVLIHGALRRYAA